VLCQIHTELKAIAQVQDRTGAGCKLAPKLGNKIHLLFLFFVQSWVATVVKTSHPVLAANAAVPAFCSSSRPKPIRESM